jgi:hypothetical protein
MRKAKTLAFTCTAVPTAARLRLSPRAEQGLHTTGGCFGSIRRRRLPAGALSVEQPTGPCWQPAHHRCRRRRGAKLLRCGFCGSVSGPFVETDWLFRVCMCTACQAGPAAGRPAPARRQDPARPVGCPAPGRPGLLGWPDHAEHGRAGQPHAPLQLTLRPPRPVSAAHRPGTSGQERSRPVHELPPDRGAALRDRLLPPVPIRRKRGQCRQQLRVVGPGRHRRQRADALEHTDRARRDHLRPQRRLPRRRQRRHRAAAKRLQRPVGQVSRAVHPVGGEPGRAPKRRRIKPRDQRGRRGLGQPLPSQVAQPPPGLRLRTPHRVPPLPAS